jgi:hypothetical protein
VRGTPRESVKAEKERETDRHRKKESEGERETDREKESEEREQGRERETDRQRERERERGGHTLLFISILSLDWRQRQYPLYVFQIRETALCIWQVREGRQRRLTACYNTEQGWISST